MAKDYTALKKQFLESAKDFEEKLMLAKSNIIRSTIYVTDTQDKLTDEATLDTIRNQIIANKKIANINISLDAISLVVSRYSQKVDTIEDVYAREYINNFSKSGKLNRWSSNGVTIVVDNTKGYALKLTTAGRMEAYSDMFEVSPTNTFKVSFSLNNPNVNNASTVAFKVYAYDKNKSLVSCKAITDTITDSTDIDLLSTKNTTNNTYQTFSGYIYGCSTEIDTKVPKGEMKRAMKLSENVRYLSIRLVLNCTEPYGDGNNHTVYIADPFIGDIDNSVVSINKQLTEAFIKLEPDKIIQSVSSSIYTKEEVNNKVTNVENKIENLNIGTENYILNSNFLSLKDTYTSDGTITVKDGTITVKNATVLKMDLAKSFSAIKASGDITMSAIATQTASSNVGLNKFIGGNIDVYSENHPYIVESIEKLKINMITVPVAVTIPNATSSNPIVEDWALNRTKAYLDNLNRANLITKDTCLIFEPHPIINGGSTSETEFNPSNKAEFFNTWKTLIVNCLKALSDYSFYGIYIGTNFSQFDSTESDLGYWDTLCKDLRALYNNHKLIYRINYWTTASWAQDLKDKYLAKLNNPLWSKVDIISIASYFELNEKKVPTVDELYNDITKGTSIYSRGQNIYQEVKNFYDKWKKPVMFGELGCPSKEYGAMSPWNNLSQNVDNQEVQKNYFEAYNRAFIYENAELDNSWFLGYSVFTIGSPTTEYNIVDKQAQSSISKGLEFIKNNNSLHIRCQINDKATNKTVADLNFPLSQMMNSVQSATTKLQYDATSTSQIIFNLKPNATFTMSKPMLTEGTKASSWVRSSEDIQADIDNIQVGGRNLLQNTDFKKLPPIKETMSGVSVAIKDGKLEIKTLEGYVEGNCVKFGLTKNIKSNTNLTISFIANTWSSVNTKVRFKMSYGVFTPWERVGNAGVNTVYTKTFNVGNITENDWFWIEFSYGVYILPNSLKIEEGTRATDWSPAIEDVQSQIDSKEPTNHRVIFARGTGFDFSGNRVIKVGNNIIVNNTSRGLNVLALNPTTLAKVFEYTYDTFGGNDSRTNFVNKINELNNGNYIIIVTSFDSSKLDDKAICEALYKIGAVAPAESITSYREAYVLIGKSKLGTGNGIEMYIPKTELDKRFAEVSVKVDDNGSFMGTTSNNSGLALQEAKKEITTTKNQVSKIENTVQGITSKVEALETTEIKSRKVASFRYVRDWLNGSTANEGKHWCELEVWADGINIARGLVPTGNGTVNNPLTNITDGNINYSTYGQIVSGGWKYIQIDLGQERNDVDMIKTWHYWADNRAYNHRLEVSRDGQTWYELFNSEKSGKYRETSLGRTYIINEANTVSRLEVAESKITKEAITSTVRENFYTKSDIDTKGYQNQSQVQQTVNGLQVKVSESGGYNLLKNSGFRTDDIKYWSDHRYNNPDATWNLLTSNDTWGFPDINVKTFQIRMSDQSDKEYGLAQWFNTTVGKKYTVSFYYAGHRCSRANMIIRYPNSNWLNNLGFNPAEHPGGNSSVSNWGYFTYTFTAVEKQHILNIVLLEAQNDGYMWIAKPQIVEGSIALPYSPNPDEVYDGITSIDKDGITVRNSGADTYTSIDASSFSVNDNRGGTIAEFSQTSLIPNLNCPGTLTAGTIYANNIPTKSVGVDLNNWIIYYVQGNYGNDNNPGNGWGTTQAFKTLEKAFSMIPTVLNQKYRIMVGGSVSGALLVSRLGAGQIEILLQDDCVVNTAIDIIGCTCLVQVHGNYDTCKGTLKQGMSLNNCTNFDVGWCSFRGANWGTSTSCNIFIFNGSRGTVRCNDFNGVTNAVIVNNSDVWFYGNRGSAVTNYIGLQPYATLYMMSWGDDYCPDYTGSMYADAGHARLYHIFEGANFSKRPSEGWNPAYTPTQKTNTWNFNHIWSDETLNGWSNVSELVQGYYSGWNTGRWTGYMQMSDGMAGIRSTISGGTNLSGRIYVQRRTSSGNSVGSKLCLYASDGTLITNSTSINRGQGVWVSLSSSIIQKIQSGAITYFYLRADSNNANTYFKCESNAKIEITYTK